VRLAALAVLGSAPETFEYEDLARSLLAGEGYRRTHLGTPYLAQTTPLYPFLCAGLYAAFGPSPLPVVLVQVLLSSLVPAVVARLAVDLGLGGRLALLAGALATVHPGLSVYAVAKLHPLSLDALLIASAVLVVTRLRRGGGPRACLGAGAVVGLAALSRPTAGLFVAPAAAWLFRSARSAGQRRALAGATLLVAGAVLVVLPWTVRNVLVLGRFVPITTDAGELLWRGNNPIATGTALLPDGRPILAGADPAFRAAILSRDQMGQYDLFRAAFWTFVRERPGAFVGGVVRKWVAFWWFPPTAGLRYPRGWLLAYRVGYAVVLALAAVGLVSLWRRGTSREARARLVPLLAMLAVVSLTQALFYVEVRHRWGVEALLGVFAAAGMGRLGRRGVALTA
jgi:4-amino-4-deoxy-L-arabinose transferase-like glycosyltransferase